MNVKENTFYQYVVKRKDDIIMQWVVKNVLMKTGLKNIVMCVGNHCCELGQQMVNHTLYDDLNHVVNNLEDDIYIFICI